MILVYGETTHIIAEYCGETVTYTPDDAVLIFDKNV